MATKTITLEIDAYNKLKAAKRSDRESFSSVVRRASFGAEPSTGRAVLAHLKALPRNAVPSDGVFGYWEDRRKEDQAKPRISESAWKRSDAS